MDRSTADSYEKKFQEEVFEGYQIKNLVDFGKSAAVFKAIAENGSLAAIKIFDNQIVGKFGIEIQEKRIQHELDLKGHDIENLVQILGGASHRIADEEYLYVIMEYIEGVNLREHIAQNGSQSEELCKETLKILLQVTNALLERDIVHRDIKPANIMLGEKEKITVMDLGVVKLIAEPSMTDHTDYRPFIGTLRYAPPEFLFRDEEGTRDCWKAVNLYQIGAVLHDLIMGKEIFGQYKEPYGKVVMAVRDELPSISRLEFNQFFLQIVRNLLVKDWKKRLDLFNQANIEELMNKKIEDDSEKIRNEIIAKTQPHREKLDAQQRKQDEIALIRKRKRELANKVVRNIESVLDSCKAKNLFGGYRPFESKEDREGKQNRYTFEIKGELNHGFFGALYVLFILSVDEHSVIELRLKALVSPGIAFTVQSIKKNLDIRFSQPRGIIQVWDGIFDEAGLLDQMERIVVKLISKSIDIMNPWVVEELERQEKMATAPQGVHLIKVVRKEDRLIESID
jgi:serine/threonine protein kinase